MQEIDVSNKKKFKKTQGLGGFFWGGGGGSLDGFFCIAIQTNGLQKI
jgi:hypothetical protein